MRVMSTQEFIDWAPEEHSNVSIKVVRARKVGYYVYVHYARRQNGSAKEMPMLVVYTAPAKTPRTH